MPIAPLAYTNMHWFSLERCFDYRVPGWDR